MNRSQEELNNEFEFKLSDILYLVRRKIWLIVLAAVVFAAVGYAYTEYNYFPSYFATSSFLINVDNENNQGENTRPTMSEVGFAQSLVPTYNEVLKSNRVMEKVAEILGLAMPPEMLKQIVTMTPVEKTSVFYVTTFYPDADIAVSLANAIADVAPDAFRETVEIGTVTVLDKAFITGIVPKNTVRNSIIGGVIGLMLSGLGVLACGYVSAKVIDVGGIEEKLMLPVLGEIKHVRKGKAPAGLAMTSDLLPSDYIRSNLLMSTLISHLANQKLMKKLLVTSTLSKEGKTMVAINLGICLARMGKSVLLIDCDMHKQSVHRYLNLPREKFTSFYGVKEDLQNQDKYIAKLERGFHVIPFIHQFDKKQVLFQSKEFIETIDELSKNYDYVILDAPSAYADPNTLNLVDSSDCVVFVVKHDRYTLKKISKSLMNLRMVGAKVIGCVLNDIKHIQVNVDADKKQRVYQQVQSEHSYAMPQLDKVV